MIVALAGLRTQGTLVDQLFQLDPLAPFTPFVSGTFASVNGRFDEGTLMGSFAMFLKDGLEGHSRS